jgi:hypothetical protein
MADDPWGKYVDPNAAPKPPVTAAAPTAPATPGNDPWSKYSGAPSNAAPAPTASSSTPAVPPGYQSPSWLPGAGWLHKVSNIYDDAATAGFADTATAKVGDLLRSIGISNATPDVGTLRAQTQQNRTDVGPIASGVTDVLGYGTGLGKVGAGEALASRFGGGLLARAGGSAAEGAAASGLGTVGHGDTDINDIGKSMAIGGVTGLVTGALPGSTPKLNTPTTAELKLIAQNKFTPLENTYLNAGNVGKQFNAADASVSPGSRVAMSPSLQGTVDDINQQIVNNRILTADDLAKFQRSLMKSARGPQDQELAGRYVSSLDTALGPHAPAVADANAATNVAKTSRDIDTWLSDPANAPKAISSALAKRPQLYQSQPGLFDALNEVGQSQPGLWSKFGGKVGGALAGAAIDATGEYLGGQNPISGAITGGLTGLLLGHAGDKFAVGPTRARLLAAQHLNATGTPAPPRSPILGPLGDFSRTAGYAAGSSGAF